MYIGIDLGTSGVKTLIIDENQNILATAESSLDVSRPARGWSEQNPAEWISATTQTLLELHKIHPDKLSSVKGIGLSGQQHGATLLDDSDKPLRPCILWNDTRSFREASTLDTPDLRHHSGNIIFPGFTAPKLLWVEKHEPDTFKKIAKVLLPKDYLRLWLTGESVSDLSDASGTGWLNVAQRDWSSLLLEQGHMRVDQMPSLAEGTDPTGSLRPELAAKFGLNPSAVVAGGAGDNAASACGMGTIIPGNAFISLGTSGVLFASNSSYLPNPESAVHTFCHAVPDTWHQMGVILSATDSLNWLAKLIGKSPSELTDELGDKLHSPGPTTFLPYLGGERTPHNDANVRGGLLGIEHTTDTPAITRAILEGVSFAFKDNLEALKQAGTQLSRLSAVGGGTRSEYWLKLLASVLNMPIDISVNGDYGAGYGAARLGLIAAEGEDPLAICTEPAVSHTLEPDAKMVVEYEHAYQRFKHTYPAASGYSLKIGEHI